MTYFPPRKKQEVSSALTRFTSLFGMGKGGTKSLQQPEQNYYNICKWKKQPNPINFFIPTAFDPMSDLSFRLITKKLFWFFVHIRLPRFPGFLTQ